MIVLVLLTVFVLPAVVSVAARLFVERPHWRTANHDATGQAPDPAKTPEAVAQVYAARTYGLRGAVAVHTWVATKRSGAEHYVRHEVIGWQLRRTGSALVQDSRPPDAMWFSNPPTLLVDLRGPQVDAVIDKIEAAVAAYPYAREYSTWPGPNSNTFTAFVGRQVPELRLSLPATAIGKDYLADGAWLGKPPSGRGWQFSLGGYAGILLAPKEGVEVHLFGAVVGVGLAPPTIKLPGLGLWPNYE